MSRQTPPDHRAPDAFAGLTQRRRERGLPTGRIDGAAAARADVFPGGGLSDEAHRKLARLQERIDRG